MSMGEQNQQVADTKAAHELSILVREYVDGHHHRIQALEANSAQGKSLH